MCAHLSGAGGSDRGLGAPRGEPHRELDRKGVGVAPVEAEGGECSRRHITWGECPRSATAALCEAGLPRLRVRVCVCVT